VQQSGSLVTLPLKIMAELRLIAKIVVGTQSPMNGDTENMSTLMEHFRINTLIRRI
jgi:hypothetical protein